MPCNSDHMEPNNLEIELSKVYDLLDELRTGKLAENYGSGFNEKVYNQGFQKNHLDAKTAELCKKLQKEDASNYSLEMQIWWRDHLKADKERIKKEIAEKKTSEERRIALSKLSPHERKLLGL